MILITVIVQIVNILMSLSVESLTPLHLLPQVLDCQPVLPGEAGKVTGVDPGEEDEVLQPLGVSVHLILHTEDTGRDEDNSNKTEDEEEESDEENHQSEIFLLVSRINYKQETHLISVSDGWSSIISSENTNTN